VIHVYNACRWCTKVKKENLALDLWPLVGLVEELGESVMEVQLAKEEHIRRLLYLLNRLKVPGDIEFCNPLLYC
jgi:hypothetical protein